ncbi:TPA: hypothetical protein ACSPZQ_001270 [Aeromonas veronii]
MSKRISSIKVIISTALVITPILIYFINFSSLSGYALSKDTQQWSDFGSYLGGIYSWFAFTGILLTIHLQRSELEHLKKQAQLDELLKLANDIYEKIYSIIFSNVDVTEFTIQTLSLTPQEITYFKRCNTYALLGAAGKSALLPNTEENDINALMVSRARSLTRDSCFRTVIEAERLEWCLRQYMTLGGSGIMSEYYISRLSLVLANISLLKFTVTPEVKSFFKVEETMNELISANK